MPEFSMIDYFPKTAIVLAIIAFVGGIGWTIHHFVTRLEKKECIESHQEPSTCWHQQSCGKDCHFSVPYTCYFTKCDKYQRYTRATRHDPWVRAGHGDW